MTGKHFVVVDGSNLATEGRKTPSLAQLDEAVRAYVAEDPDAEMVVVVDASFEHRIDPKEARQLEQAELHGELVSPPAGAIGRGDAFVLRIAERTGAKVLSNDSFQEFHQQHQWLFDDGRLIGGKPVPGVGWIFTPRTPVRGSRSRHTDDKGKSGRRQAAEMAPAEKAAELAKAAKRAAQRGVVRNGDGSMPRVGDVWVASAGEIGAESASARAGKETHQKEKKHKKKDAKSSATAAEPALATPAAAKAPKHPKAEKAEKAKKATKAKKAPAIDKAPRVEEPAAAPVRARTTKAGAKATKAATKAATKKEPATKAVAETAKGTKATQAVKATRATKSAKTTAATKATKTTKATKAAAKTPATRTTNRRVRAAIVDATAEALEPEESVAAAAGSAKKRPSTAQEDGAAKRKRRRAAPPPAVNEPMAFIEFVAAYPMGSQLTGHVASFTSHGAMVEVPVPEGGAVYCYIPLMGLGKPPPAKARDVLSRGEQRTFVLVALDPARRVAELALPEVEAAAAKRSKSRAAAGR